jgi:hypothetical protein
VRWGGGLPVGLTKFFPHYTIAEILRLLGRGGILSVQLKAIELQQGGIIFAALGKAFGLLEFGFGLSTGRFLSAPFLEFRKLQ